MNKNTDKKKKTAVAIKYTEDMQAPKVIAKGKGYIAENIIEKAKEKDVHIYENKELVEELAKIDIGLSIPPELYEVVAQVLIFVSEIKKKEEYRKYAK